MPEGEDLYLTVAEEIPYVQYVALAYKLIDGIYNFGRETETEKAIRLLNERVAELEQAVRDLEDRLSDLEQRVAQGENRDRLRMLTTHQLAFGELARDLASRPGEAGSVAAKALARLRAMFEDEDLWMWSDTTRKPEDAPDAWRLAPPAFKGLGLPVFAVGTMIWALAVQGDVAGGVPAASHRPGATDLLRWVSTRPEWIPYQTPPQSLAERFRAAINVQIIISTQYVTPAGYCEYSFVAVNDIDRSRETIREVDMYFGPAVNQLCTADPRIADGDEAILEDESPPLQILAVLEEVVNRLRDRGTMAEPFIGQFPDWTAHRLTLFGIEPSGQLRRFQLSATTALTEPPVVEPVGGVVGVGWQHLTEVFGTFDTVLYAFSADGAVDWYREVDVSRGPSGWQGPQRVRPAPGFSPRIGRDRFVHGGGGTFYVISQYQGGGHLGISIKRDLSTLAHPDPSSGTGVFGAMTTVKTEWPSYEAVFGGDRGVIYGIDSGGDLYWHKHSGWEAAGRQFAGPVKIGNGWNSFSRVIAFGDGFIAGVFPNGEMLLYHFKQWEWGPQGGSPQWHGPVKVPGTRWRGFKTLVPSVGDAPVIVH